MSVKTVCEDLFNMLYKQALSSENPLDSLNKSVKDLENIVHALRLFYYLNLIAKELGIELPPKGNFAQNFKVLLEEVLKVFYQRYQEDFPQLAEDDFIKSFTERKISLQEVDPYIEDLIILLLGFLVDKNLSEVFTTTKIKNLVREIRNFPKGG